MVNLVTVLGSTGSIGRNTLDVIAAHPDRFKVIGLTAQQNIAELFQQCVRFKPQSVVVVDAEKAHELQQQLAQHGSQTEVYCGRDALSEIAADSASDTVVAAIVGADGLLPTLSAVRQGKRVLLANKEALVMSGALFIDAVAQSQAMLLPVDSEHNALLQCMPPHYQPGAVPPSDVSSMVLTASGGPFRTLPLNEFSAITPAQAIAHPNWKMGAKISVDSATMVNKGLEVAEAFWLFQSPIEKIKVVIHPQSIVHAMVNYIDGSTLAQMGYPDMRTPIANALAWPERISASVNTLDLTALGQLDFYDVDISRYPCLKLAYQALQAGGSAMTIFNAANEVAVAAFLAEKIRYLQIAEVLEHVLLRVNNRAAESIDQILDIDAEARAVAHEKCHLLNG